MRDTFYNLKFLNLYDLQNQNDAFFSDFHRYAKGKAEDNGNYFPHLPVPEEVVVSSDGLVDLTGKDIYTFYAWLELLNPYSWLSGNRDEEIVLGHQSRSDPYNYEEYIRNRIRKFQPIWRKYGLQVGYNIELIASDLERLSKIILYAGKYPSFTPLRLCENICLIPGPGILNENVERFKKILNDRGRTQELSELEEFLLEDIREWVTVQFKRIFVPYLRTIKKLIHHILAGHLNGDSSANRIDLSKACHLCLLCPKPIDRINPSALQLSARFFEHLHLPAS